MTSFELRLNGEAYSVEVPPNTPLLWVVRDALGLTGTKYGCGRGYCGACMVHIDGRALPSCTIPVSGVGDSEITTIEGLSSNGDHPAQLAWIEEDVPQCGYCQAGQVMSTAALLDRIPNPSDAEIDSAMSGNLCRCGTYVRIRRAIHRAADIANGE